MTKAEWQALSEQQRSDKTKLLVDTFNSDTADLSRDRSSYSEQYLNIEKAYSRFTIGSIVISFVLAILNVFIASIDMPEQYFLPIAAAVIAALSTAVTACFNAIAPKRSVVNLKAQYDSVDRILNKYELDWKSSVIEELLTHENYKRMVNICADLHDDMNKNRSKPNK